MAELVENEAAKPNPALEPLSVLVGTWRTIGTHPLVPGTAFHGRTSFSWIEGGAFLIMHSRIDEITRESERLRHQIERIRYTSPEWPERRGTSRLFDDRTETSHTASSKETK